MIAKVLACAAIAAGAAVGVAAPAMADPSPNPTSPSDSIGSLAINCADDTVCPPTDFGNVATVDPRQLNAAIKTYFSGTDGLSDLQGQQ